jgi:tetratricopeptide (TPR) repeat protein
VDKKLTKEEIRNPDQLTQGLNNLADFVRKNAVIFGVIILGIIAIGGIVTVLDYVKTQKEEKLQGEMSGAEREYTDKKSKFKEADRADELKAAAKDVKKSPKKDAKDEAKDEKKPELVKASGDLQKDYGSVVDRFQSILAKDPTTKAGQMSAIYLAELYNQYKKPDEAIQSLDKAVPKNEANDMLSALVLNLKAGLIADKGDCPKAVDIWQKLMNDKKTTYMHDEAKLRMAMCYEKMNEPVKAEQYYTELSKAAPGEDGGDRAVSEDAKKYLRLLKVRANGGT